MKRNTNNSSLIGKLTGLIFMMIVMFAMALPASAALVWPVPASHRITQGYHGSNAIDIGAGTGTPIVAAMSGTVTNIWKCTQTHHNYGDCHGFGTGLVILGDDGRAYQYAHMQAGSIPANVYKGARVNAGQQIGCVGQTGYAYGPHLHFGISYNANYWQTGPDPSKESYGPADLTGVYVGSQQAVRLGGTNIKLSGTLYKRAGINASAVGIYLGTSKGGMSKRNTEAVGSAANNYRGGASFDIWYDLKNELGISLADNTTYYYRIYAIVEGREIKGDIQSFTIGTPKVSKKNGSLTVSNLTAFARSKNQTVQLKVKRSGTGKVTYKSSSKKITVNSKGVVSIPKNTAGTVKIQVSVAADKTYKAITKTYAFTVKKNSQPMKISRNQASFRASDLKKKQRTVSFSVKNAAGKVTICSNSKYIKVTNNIFGRKITVRKGTPKGTYKVTVRAAGNTLYQAGTRTITIYVK